MLDELARIRIEIATRRGVARARRALNTNTYRRFAMKKYTAPATPGMQPSTTPPSATSTAGPTNPTNEVIAPGTKLSSKALPTAATSGTSPGAGPRPVSVGNLQTINVPPGVMK
jgi:hypothetical protein